MIEEMPSEVFHAVKVYDRRSLILDYEMVAGRHIVTYGTASGYHLLEVHISAGRPKFSHLAASDDVEGIMAARAYERRKAKT